MSINGNNYIGHDLEYTKWTSVDDLPVGVPLVFKKADGELMFGTVHMINNGRSKMAVVDNAFHFDRIDELKTSEWASLSFVFKTEDELWPGEK